MALAAAGLIGVGVVLSDDPRPIPAPRAAQATPVTAPAVLSPPRTAPPPAAPADGHMFVIQALCLQAPDGFCEQIGVAEERDTNSAWVLSRREARMLNALIRAEKEKGGLEVLSRPQLLCANNQSGHVQIGQDVPIITKVESQEKDGTTITKTTTDRRPVGTGLRVTPRGMPDGTVLLRVGMQLTELASQPGNLGDGTTTPAFNIQSVTTTVVLEESGTAMIRGGTTRSADGKKRELLWVLTPHIVKATPPGVPPANRPAPVAPPVPAPVPVQLPPLLFVPSTVVPPAADPPTRPAPLPAPADQPGPVRTVPPPSPGEAAPVLPGRRP
jgi:hypothetical protein